MTKDSNLRLLQEEADTQDQRRKAESKAKRQVSREQCAQAFLHFCAHLWWSMKVQYLIRGE